MLLISLVFALVNCFDVFYWQSNELLKKSPVLQKGIFRRSHRVILEIFPRGQAPRPHSPYCFSYGRNALVSNLSCIGGIQLRHIYLLSV